MPYAYIHYPFENEEFFQKNFPGHFVAEGLDQTRGWFVSLLFSSFIYFHFDIISETCNKCIHSCLFMFETKNGRFYTLMVLSTALFEKPAFRNLICNGLVLAEDGKKMSKRLKNYPSPMEVIDEYGAVSS